MLYHCALLILWHSRINDSHFIFSRSEVNTAVIYFILLICIMILQLSKQISETYRYHNLNLDPVLSWSCNTIWISTFLLETGLGHWTRPAGLYTLSKVLFCRDGSLLHCPLMEAGKVFYFLLLQFWHFSQWTSQVKIRGWSLAILGYLIVACSALQMDRRWISCSKSLLL